MKQARDGGTATTCYKWRATQTWTHPRGWALCGEGTGPKDKLWLAGRLGSGAVETKVMSVLQTWVPASFSPWNTGLYFPLILKLVLLAHITKVRTLFLKQRLLVIWRKILKTCSFSGLVPFTVVFVVSVWFLLLYVLFSGSDQLSGFFVCCFFHDNLQNVAAK